MVADSALNSIQCFGPVGWTTRTASDLWKSTAIPSQRFFWGT